MTDPTRRTLLAGLAGAALASPLAGCSSAGSSPTATSGTPSSPATGAPSGTSSAPPTTPTTPTAPASAASSSPAAGPDVTHGPRTRQAVALTFHGAGDAGILKRMLAEFKDAGAHVTVLAIGTWLAQEPSVAKLVLDGGHDLGNHTWSHQTMTRLSASQVTGEVQRGAAELRKLTGTPGRWFRPSGTPTSTPAIRAAAVTAGYGACLGYDVDPLDYTDPGPAAIEKAFAAKVQPGSIVSLHLGHAGTLAAMPALLATLHDRRLTAVTASDLLGTR